MKIKVKIKSIRCPSCSGNGLFMDLDGTKCMWCKGKKKIGKAAALRYADTMLTIAIGGYIAGDHNLEDARQMKKQAREMFSIFKHRIPTEAW